MHRKLGLICLVALCLFASSLRAAAQEPALLFAGVVDSQPIRVAAAYQNGKLALFFCGDADNVATHTQWFRAPLSGQTIEKNGWKVRLYYATQDALAGWLQLPGAARAVHWVARRAAGDVGLYRADDEHGVSGAIVTDLDGDGTLELQGAVRFPGPGGFAQIVPVGTLAPQEGALEVSVPSEAGGFTPVTVRRVEVIDF
jgi:hypothetical protein